MNDQRPGNDGYPGPDDPRHHGPQYGGPQHNGPQYNTPQHNTPQPGNPQYGAPGQGQPSGGDQHGGQWGNETLKDDPHFAPTQYNATPYGQPGPLPSEPTQAFGPAGVQPPGQPPTGNAGQPGAPFGAPGFGGPPFGPPPGAPGFGGPGFPPPRRNNNTAVLAVIGGVVLIVAIAVAATVGIVFANRSSDDSHTSADASRSSSTADDSTESSDSSTTPGYTPYPTYTTTTTTEAPTLYGGIAFAGSGAYNTSVNYSDADTAKTTAVNACNTSIHSKGWGSDSYCGYVPIQTGYCGSVATATVASGWGPTGWSQTTGNRAQAITLARDKCDSLGQGTCHELITLCM